MKTEASKPKFERARASLVYIEDEDQKLITFPCMGDSIICQHEDFPKKIRIHLVNIDNPELNVTEELDEKNFRNTGMLLVMLMNLYSEWFWASEQIYGIHVKRCIHRLIHWAKYTNSSSTVLWYRPGIIRDLVEEFFGDDYLTVQERNEFGVVTGLDCPPSLDLFGESYRDNLISNDSAKVYTEIVKKIHGGYDD